MRFRKLGIAWSVGCAVAGVLLVALWVRSYSWADAVPTLHLASAQGTLYVKQSLQLQPGSKIYIFRMGIITMSLDGQKVVRVGPAGLVIPIWTLKLLALALALSPWLIGRLGKNSNPTH